MMLLLLSAGSASAVTIGDRDYTPEHPLVYEDPLNLWPFSYLNEQGEPEGFNIDLLKALMEELRIPYVIRLKPQQEVLEDLRSGKSDLTLGPTATFYKFNSKYGRHTITLLTQSVAAPAGQPATVRTFRDLSRKGQQVIVKDSSLCHHLMRDYGWGRNAVPTADMGKTIREVSRKGEGQIVWNTLSLEWLIHHYQLDNMRLEPVDMPYTEFKYMSGNQPLLDLIDLAYARMNADGRMAPLEERWFYHFREDEATPVWAWWLVGLMLPLFAAALVYMVRTVRQGRPIGQSNNKLEGQLAELTGDGKTRLWKYNVRRQTFSWLDAKGRSLSSVGRQQFSTRYNKADWQLLSEALDRLITPHRDTKGHVETETTVELMARDAEYGDTELHHFVVVLSVLNRDSEGCPADIVATKKDVSRELRLKETNQMRSLRYWSVFYNDESGVMQFDKDGYLTNANPKAGEHFQINIDQTVQQHTHISQILGTTMPDNLNKTDGTSGSKMVGERRVEYQLNTVCNDSGEVLGLFVFSI